MEADTLSLVPFFRHFAFYARKTSMCLTSGWHLLRPSTFSRPTSIITITAKPSHTGDAMATLSSLPNKAVMLCVFDGCGRLSGLTGLWQPHHWG